MRALRSMATACLIGGIATGTAAAQQLPSPDSLLTGFKPSQPGVEYESPADKDAIAACTVDFVQSPQGAKIGFALRDKQGKFLRKFVDANGNGKLDQWSYYQDGFEVYREIDLDNDLSIDECHWINQGGTRIATVKQGKVTGWKRLSAEEASKVLVQGIVLGRSDMITSVFVTPEELAAQGIPQAEIDRASEDAKKRAEAIAALVKNLAAHGWDKQTSWLRFDGTMPRTIPQDANDSLKNDIVLYENAVIFAGRADGSGDPSKVAYLQVPELIKVGDAWKFVDIPRAVEPGQKQIEVAAGATDLRTTIYTGSPSAGGEGPNPKLEEALKELGEYDVKNAEKYTSDDKKAVAEYYTGRIALLQKILGVAKSDDTLYRKQVVDSYAAAYQTGAYPKGAEELDAIIKEGGKVASHAAFRKILADYALQSDSPDANLLAIQKKLLEDLEAFVKQYPESEEAPDALLQLAHANEFNADEEGAKSYYNQLAEKYPKSEPGKKATGALRRLNLVGQPLELKGQGIDGKPVDVAALRGKTVLVVFWASWADQAKRDLPELKKVADKYKDKNFAVVGVNVDNDRNAALGVINEQGLSGWPQIHEPGGIEGRPAQEFGIMSLPTMFLVDPEGKVLSRGLRLPTEVDKQLDKELAAGIAGRDGTAKQ